MQTSCLGAVKTWSDQTHLLWVRLLWESHSAELEVILLVLNGNTLRLITQKQLGFQPHKGSDILSSAGQLQQVFSDSLHTSSFSPCTSPHSFHFTAHPPSSPHTLFTSLCYRNNCVFLSCFPSPLPSPPSSVVSSYTIIYCKLCWAQSCLFVKHCACW